MTNKKLKTAIILMMMLCVLLSGCGSGQLSSTEDIVEYNNGIEYIAIDDTDLAYDKDTLIVYRVEQPSAGYKVHGTYYSENGRLVKYIDSEFVEIENETENNINNTVNNIAENLEYTDEHDNKIRKLENNDNCYPISDKQHILRLPGESHCILEEHTIENEKCTECGYSDSANERKIASEIFWNTDSKAEFAENYSKAHAEGIDNAYSVRVYYDLDETYHACGSMIYGRGDTYSEHDFTDQGMCIYCGYIREEDRDN